MLNHFTFFMKINNILVKLHSTIKNFNYKFLGNTKKADNIIKIFISILISLNIFYYFVDFGYNKVLSIVGTFIVSYLAINIIFYLLQKIYFLVSRFKARNIISFLFLYFLIEKFISKISYDVGLDDFEILISVFYSLIILIFAKTLVGIFLNKKKIIILPFVLTSLVLICTIGFIFLNLTSKPKNMDIAYKSRAAEYSSNHFDYELGEVSLLDYVSYSGNTKKIRDFYFKKSLARTNISGRVWYPQNKKSSGVIFMIHGNHRFTAKNHLGYDYLGKFLARRGYVFISVDENMLNGFMTYGLSKENDARAILLLENIKAILRENKDKNSKFYNIIDENKIILAGHSRGGEAAFIANNLNSLKYNPLTSDEMNYNFNIQGLLLVAPTSNQYTYDNKYLKAKGVSLLTVHGTHDLDVTNFEGLELYNNTEIDNNNFKVAVYVPYFNHGHFNSTWDMDYDSPYNLLIDRSSLIKRDFQEEFLSKISLEFLDNVFMGKKDLSLINGKDRSILLDSYVRYSDFPDVVCDFEDDDDITTFKEGKIRFNNLVVKEQGYSGYDNGTVVSIKSRKLGRYELEFNNPIKLLDFIMFDIDIKSLDGDIRLVLTDTYGKVSSVNLKDYNLMMDRVGVINSKIQKYRNTYTDKSSLQTLKIYVKDFKDIDLNNIRYIGFDFTSARANIAIDDIRIK